MKLEGFVLGMFVFLILGFVLLTMLPIIPIGVESHIYEGDIIDVQYISGAFFVPAKTIVQTENGIITFCEHNEKIIETKNIHMEYRTNMYEMSFLDKFTIIEKDIKP